MVDSFGTDAEFNYHGYRKPIPGGPSTWGKLDLDLRQFMTMFRKLHYVFFLFVIETDINCNFVFNGVHERA